MLLFTPSPRFFQDDLLAQLTARIKTLKDAGGLSDVPARLSLSFGWLGVLVWDLVCVMFKYWLSFRILGPY